MGLTLTCLPGGSGDYYLAGLLPEGGRAEPAMNELMNELGIESASEHGGRSRREPDGAGTWLGQAAGPLGLSGTVSHRPFGAMLRGEHPAGSRNLVSRRGDVAAYDLVLSAPKSVSVLFGVADAGVARAVLEAHDHAVAAAVGYIERRAVAVRRTAGAERTLLPASGVIAAGFSHSASRARDPHLHTHVVVANMAHGEDGRWTAIDGRGLFAHAPAAGRLYEAHLRHELSDRLAVGWTARREGRLEVAGIDPVVLGTFSGRAAEIREHLAERGLSSRRANRVAWAATRSPKEHGTGAGTLRRAWRDRAEGSGFGGPEVASVLGRSLVPTGGIDERRFAAALAEASPSGGTRRDVLGAWAGALRRGAPLGEVEAAVDHWWEHGASSLGVAEPRGTLGVLMPSEHVLRALGPRPSSAAAQPLWRGTAAAVESYRRRWGVDDPQRALGPGPGEGGRTMEARQVVERHAVERELDRTCRRLGRTPRPDVPEIERGFGRGFGRG